MSDNPLPTPRSAAGAPIVPNAGGSALIEGVMMQVEGRIGVAARREDGSIVTELLFTEPAPSRLPNWLRTLPGLRGIFGVGAGLGRSLEAMRWSTIQAGAPVETMRSRPITVLLVASIFLGASLFSLLPYLALQQIHVFLDPGLLATSIETAVRFGLIIGYMLLAARQRTVAATFAYHGAEHVTVSCYESGRPLTPENAATFTTAHPRCGTNFTFLVLAGVSLVGIATTGVTGFGGGALRFGGVFLAAGLSYELMRAAASRMDQRWARLAMAPGLALQRLTTRRPSLAQIEVAISALRTACTPAQLAEIDARTTRTTRTPAALVAG